MKMWASKVAVFLSLLFVSIVGGFTLDVRSNKVVVGVQEAKANEHPFSIQLVIDYLNYQLLPGPPMNIIYPYPGFQFVNNDETEFNQLVWDDERVPGGYPWGNFYDIGDTAYDWNFNHTFETGWLNVYASVNQHNVDIPALETEVDNQGNAITTLEADVAAAETDIMDHAGMIAALEADMASAQDDMLAMADDMASAQAVMLTLPSPSEFAGMEADLADKVDKTTTVNGHSLTGNVTVTPSDLGLGSAALLNVPTSGDAAAGQVVKGNDTRLTDSRAPTAHNHAASEITSGTLDAARIPTLAQAKVTDLTTDLASKSAKASFSGVSTLSAHGVSSGATDGATDAPTNAPTDAPTNYGVLAAILGADINATNAKQNTTAGNVNSLAAKYNALATKYNDLATKVNTLMTWLNTAKDRVNDLKAAGAN